MNFHGIVVMLCLVCEGAEPGLADRFIRPGDDINDAKKIMAEFGYKETALDMAATTADSYLLMWDAGEGVLICTCSSKANKVLAMSYFLCDERPTATRKSFDLVVREFNPRTGELKIVLPRTGRAASR